jgi:prophage DNA circulation protein
LGQPVLLGCGASEAQIDALEQEFDRLSAAVQRTAGQLQKAGVALDDTGAAAGRAAADVASVADAASGSGPAFRDLSAELENTSFSLGAVSREALNALVAMNEYAGMTRLWVERINSVTSAIRQQRESADLLNTQLDEQLARVDPLQEKLQQLKRDYSFLDEAQLRQIAQKQEQLEREEARLARDSERAKQETERAQQRNDNGGTSSSGPAPRPSGGTAQGGSGGPVNITVNIEGVIGDIDRGSLEQFARQLKPILDRIAANSR